MKDLKSVVSRQPLEPVEDHPTNKERVAHKLIWGLLVTAALCILVLIYWGVAKNDVLEIHNSPVPVRTVAPKTTADGIVVLKVDYCKKVAATGKVRASFVDGAREIFIPMYEDKGSAGCRVVDSPIGIPHEIVPGKYHIHFRIVYKVNPLKDVTEEFDSLPFEVAPSGD